MPVFKNILKAIVKTPLVELQHIVPAGSARILVKFEGLQIGGSIKTRTALSMVEDAQRRGVIDKDSILVEASSGNQGIGLALVGAVMGYKVRIVMPDSVSGERAMLMKQYGAEVVYVKDEGDIGACIQECLETAYKMQREDVRVFLPQQFENPANPRIQREATAQEILADADGSVHGYCSGVGTGGTLSGVGEVLKAANPDMTIWAVEPENAAILAGGAITTHLQMGIGDGLVPKNLNTAIYDEVCVVTDEEALQTAKRLAREEGLLCGISSGSNVAGALRMAQKLGGGKTVVTILPDTGERYFSTALFQ